MTAMNVTKVVAFSILSFAIPVAAQPVVGAAVIVVLTACFPEQRIGFLLGLAVWGAACGFVATLLRNFAAWTP